MPLDSFYFSRIILIDNVDPGAPLLQVVGSVGETHPPRSPPLKGWGIQHFVIFPGKRRIYKLHILHDRLLEITGSLVLG